MHLALLIGIVVMSVLVNVALIVMIARADDIVVRVPESLQAMFDALRTEAARPLAPPPRRELYVAAASRPVVTAPSRCQVGGPCGPHPLAETLPPDLAELLSRPAELATGPDPEPVLSGLAARPVRSFDIPGQEAGGDGHAAP